MQQAGDIIGQAVQRCPFLGHLAGQHGDSYARHIATRPTVAVCPVSAAVPPASSGDVADFQATFQLFHGANGVVALSRFAKANPSLQCPDGPAQQQSGCPFQHDSPQAPCSQPGDQAYTAASRSAPPAAYASLSLSAFNFLPDPGDLFRQWNKARGKQPKPKPQRKPPASSSGSSASSSTGANRGVQQRCSGRLKGAASPGQPSGGKCPLRRVAGPLGGLLPLAANGRLQCPPAIVAMRAAVARLTPVRDLRPRALPVKALAVGGFCSLLNVPFGAAREHTRKFSPEWFVAVHATIPFVAALRKAVVMPPWAILLTIGGAIAGQLVGARLERHRLVLQAAELQAGSGKPGPQPVAARKGQQARSSSSGCGPHSPSTGGHRPDRRNGSRGGPFGGCCVVEEGLAASFSQRGLPCAA